MVTSVIVGIFGLIIGSYLNVCILRLHTGRSTAGRSGCMSCLHPLSWHELIPVVSYLVLRGRCRACGSSISKQYAIVELLTASLFVLWAHIATSWYELSVGAALISVCIVLAVYDLRHTVIPNILVYGALALALALRAPELVYGDTVWVGASMVIGAFVAAGPLFVLWLVSKGRWMGFGDVKLALVFGTLLGAYGGSMAVLWGFVIGACVGLGLLGLQRVTQVRALGTRFAHLTIKSEIPFAPFLLVGFGIVWFFSFDLLQVSMYLVQ